jgi:hypothetical protein
LTKDLDDRKEWLMVRDEELWYEVVMEKGRRRVVGGLLKYSSLGIFA